MVNKVEVYECSDGFLTKSLGVYKRREKVLKHYKKLGDNASAWLKRVGKERDLAEAELSDEAYKVLTEQRKLYALFDIWKKSKPEYICETCKGSGSYEWSDEGYGPTRYYTEDCPSCKRTGITDLARKIYDSGKWLKEAKLLTKESKSK